MDREEESRESLMMKAKLYVFEEDWKEQSLGIPKINGEAEVLIY